MDRGLVAMKDLRNGDRVLSVNWDGSLAFKVRAITRLALYCYCCIV